MRIKEIRRIDINKVRALCIRYNLYTMGTNQEYSDMLKMCKAKNVTANQLFKIAKNIYDHSDKINKPYDVNSDVSNLMSHLSDCTYSLFEITK